jgi:hypothetical protein
MEEKKDFPCRPDLNVRKPRCVQLGRVLRDDRGGYKIRLVQLPGCRGELPLALFGCAIYGEIVLPQCHGCPDYQCP